MHYHLIGICDTAMASLAGMLQARGHRVTGSDQNVYPPMSTMLAGLGIEIMRGDDEFGDVGAGGRGPRARLPGRRRGAELRRELPRQRFALLRDRGRRVRHGL